jgi:hypothetical protein
MLGLARRVIEAVDAKGNRFSRNKLLLDLDPYRHGVLARADACLYRSGDAPLMAGAHYDMHAFGALILVER